MTYKNLQHSGKNIVLFQFNPQESTSPVNLTENNNGKNDEYVGPKFQSKIKWTSKKVHVVLS